MSMKSLKLYSKISIIILIFFSLQGEVIQRYFTLFQSHKLGYHLRVPKKTVERQQLIKLQCFTQKLQPLITPYNTEFNFQPILGFEFKTIFPATYVAKLCFTQKTPASLRGPPAFS
jgi:hypothetical protein